MFSRFLSRLVNINMKNVSLTHDCLFLAPVGLSVPLKSFTLGSPMYCRSRRKSGRRHREQREVLPDEPDNLEAIEDFINEEGNLRRGEVLNEKTKDLIKSHIQEDGRKIKRKIMERKYFKKLTETSLLTWKAKEQICFLNSEYPEEWTPEELAESFPVSVEGVRHILKSTYRPKSDMEIQKHDQRVAANWRQLKEAVGVEGGPAESQPNNFQHLLASKKLHLMVNAGGSSSLPMPRLTSKGGPASHQKEIGLFESIVASSEDVKVTEKRMLRKDTVHEFGDEVMLQEIADTGSKKRLNVKKEKVFKKGTAHRLRDEKLFPETDDPGIKRKFKFTQEYQDYLKLKS